MSPASIVLLPCTPSSVSVARWRLTADLHDAGIESPVIGDAALVVSELLSNAILHARPLPGARVQVAWALDGRSLELAVSDAGGMTRPHVARPSPSAIGGRGLAIVEHLTCRWGVRNDAAGVTVWAVMAAPRNGNGYAPGAASGECGTLAHSPGQ